MKLRCVHLGTSSVKEKKVSAQKLNNIKHVVRHERQVECELKEWALSKWAAPKLQGYEFVTNFYVAIVAIFWCCSMQKMSCERENRNRKCICNCHTDESCCHGLASRADPVFVKRMWPHRTS